MSNCPQISAKVFMQSDRISTNLQEEIDKISESRCPKRRGGAVGQMVNAVGN